MTINLTEEERIKVSGPDDLYRIMQRILQRENKIDLDKEHFWMVGMNEAGVILYIELVSLGSVRAVNVEPINIYRVAVLKNATRVIAVHNHPSYELTPSEDDLDITDRLIQAGLILGIKLEDHLIISPENFTSFARLDIMAALFQSTKYVPTYVLIDRVKAQEKALRENALLEQKIYIARRFLNQGLSTQQIAEALEISISELDQLLGF